ncbi:MAG: hypothetical protein A2Y00_10810 [Omnitrophica WOR_2 bacterium GWF2_43_52]|nr:MAG: hypothetical protein A2062_04940 [Omnitrophica WOR_2 bacterium GWA2_44_7]OGX20778.1 MAG: hypothetical protein A2Y00_10810 [Omnitrophica WOR_2 bacterium GWF2_43_52]HAH19805.1 hypothetical protein [Candidatus Omnitrophota bacterium]HBG63430.1 hypothetical protein [Candidatus Omnitrophota bacterium]
MKNNSNIFFKVIKWLYPGMRVKRWIALLTLAVVLITFGSARLLVEPSVFYRAFYILAIFTGVFLGILGLRNILGSFINVFIPPGEREIVDMIYRKRYLEKGPRIVAIGGGTGLSALLYGLKEYTSNISAVVTVADDGGSSGRIRQEFDILPPGDIRNCLVALADAPSLMQDLFQFRFDTSSELSGHSFGNLFITVMTKLTGDFEKAVKESSKVLAIRGQVIPSTLNKVSLVARYRDGTTTEGEASIPKKKQPIAKISLKPQDAIATPEALKAISEAQAIILGPGSLYTSVIPNLLIKEIRDAVTASSALKIYICNVMTQLGETEGYSAFDHIKAVIDHSSPKIIDYCVVNVTHIAKELLDRYSHEYSYPVVVDMEKIRHAGYRVIEADIINAKDYVRHDSGKLARIISDLIQENF